MNPEISPITLEALLAPVSHTQTSHLKMNRRAHTRTGSRTSCKVLA
jgi:hypothetical protein